MQRVCVFCGSTMGSRPAYAAAAAALGRHLAARGIAVVTGGGSVGLMGVLADAALTAGGEVIGVIPHDLVQREIAHRGLTALHVVDTMHERKAMMAGLADGFIALPGGIGTLEELFETWTWAQLGVHRHPVALLDVEGYWQPLLGTVRHLATEGFLRPATEQLLLVDDDPAGLLDRMGAHDPPAVRKWVRLGET